VTSTETTVIREVPPEFARQKEVDGWIGLGLALLVLTVTAMTIRRRRPQPFQDPPSRKLRVFNTALGFAGIVTLMLVAEHFWHGRDADRLLPNAVFGLMATTFASIVLFGIAEFWLGLLRPVRTQGWLIGAMLSFGALVVGLVVFVLWIQDSAESLFVISALQLPVLGAVAGTIWWSHLPTLRSDIARTFE